MLVETMYNKLAINTGFPTYVKDSEAPETQRFLLEILSQSLLNVIDNIYISNNVLERRDTITLTPGQDHYDVEGMVKSIQYTANNSGNVKGKRVAFDYFLDVPNQVVPYPQTGTPIKYVMDKGQIRVYPIPDKPYNLEVTVSTTDLVWANDDSSRNTIENIKDSVMASKEFCEVVILKACAFLMGRCNNPLAEFYNNLAKDRIKTFVERDGTSFEQPHLYNPIKGHYNPRRGLLD